MKSALLISGLLALLPAALGGQENQLGLVDGAGNYYAVLNCYAGSNEYVMVRKSDPSGNVLWTQVRNMMVDERAAAATIDPSGSLVVAAVRKNPNGLKTLVLFRYGPAGQFEWDRFFNDSIPNVPTAVAADAEGSFFVGGNALRNGRNVARLWKFDRFGSYLWYRETDNGSGNTYVRQLMVDLTGVISLVVESFQSQSATSGQYALMTLLYDKDGNKVWR
ncbi:MAG: hypothetical protein HY748_05460 [Elusimicrobia bacterium]|nr:hypothetical protein [Elusimicrobiota bacterium]